MVSMSDMPFGEGEGLRSLRDIAKHMGCSENAMRRLIVEQDFPAAKIAGQWTSDTALIAQWRKDKIRGRKHREVRD